MDERYADGDCRYLGGDPRLDERGLAEVSLMDDGIWVKLLASEEPGARLHIPKAAIEFIRTETQHVGMEQAEFEEDVLIEPDEYLIRHVVVLHVKDPEGIGTGDWQVRIGFRNDYYARVFEKRCTEAYELPPF